MSTATPCFIQRDGAGKIVGVFASEQPDLAAEASTYETPEVTAFLAVQQMPLTLAAKLANGIAITSTGTPGIDATYALDATTLNQIGSVARDAAGGLGLPGSGATFAYPDITGAPKTFTAATIQDLYKAMRDCVFALNETADTLAQGGTASWPGQTATIA